ncbi:unnamed protein product [Schistocephalus solidus]|uniref:Rod shape-determining protein MreC n=1 Tax=Schistocephalus solidus TaxID=70667 RepID=A0A183TT33_SCHSO|nr:unnamed protein product [Schistocephalus solidus]
MSISLWLLQLLKQYAPLELFWRRFNKVQLDRLALLKEREVLTNQNENLKLLLTQYLDGLSVNDAILAKPNSLFVVNGRSNLNPNPLVKDARVRPVATVKLEALHIYKDSVTSGLLEK